MSWLDFDKTNFTTGSNIVPTTSATDVSKITGNSALQLLGTNQIVAVKRGYVDQNNNKIIELYEPWPYADAANANIQIWPTDGDLTAATQELRAFTQAYTLPVEEAQQAAADAANSATTAQNALDSIGDAEINSAASAQLAKDYAEKGEDVEVEAGTYSSKHYSIKAALAEAAAQGYANQAALILDNFDDRYLGVKSADPLVDNDGDPLIDGAIYFNSSDNTLRFYVGGVWQVPEQTISNLVAQALQYRNEAEGFRNEAQTFRNEAEAFKNEAGSIVGGDFALRKEITKLLTLADGATLNLNATGDLDKFERVEIIILGLTGTINLPAVPLANVRYDIKTTKKPTDVQVNTSGGTNAHNINFIDGDVDTSASIQGNYALSLLWNNTEYEEVQ